MSESQLVIFLDIDGVLNDDEHIAHGSFPSPHPPREHRKADKTHLASIVDFKRSFQGK